MLNLSLVRSLKIWIVVTVAVIVSTTTYADVPESWTILASLGTEKERSLNRYGDHASMKYQEPWVIYDEHWLIFKDGKYLDAETEKSKMAINCLTGANGRSIIEEAEPDEAFLKRIERERNWQTAISIVKPSEGLHESLLKFACHCNKPMVDEIPDTQRIRAIYNSQVINQTSVEMAEVRTVMFETQQLALDALRVAGKDNIEIEKLSRAEGVADMPNDGYLGWNPLASYSLSAQQELSNLKPGQISQEVVASMHGFNVHQLIARRVEPALPLQKWRSSIESYLRYFDSCRK